MTRTAPATLSSRVPIVPACACSIPVALSPIGEGRGPAQLCYTFARRAARLSRGWSRARIQVNENRLRTPHPWRGRRAGAPSRASHGVARLIPHDHGGDPMAEEPREQCLWSTGEGAEAAPNQ